MAMETDWHTKPADLALQMLNTQETGLSGGEAEQRLKTYGPNQLPMVSGRSALQRLLTQFNNVLVYVLLAAALVTAGLGHFLDCAVILGVTIINAVIGYIQEGRAERALDAIKTLMSPQAGVLREGRRIDIPADQVVPGDIVVLQPGDRVPADLRLLRCKGLSVQESVLTGESMAVDKDVGQLPAGTPLGDRFCMAYSGTLVTQGSGSGVVVATGVNTEIGRIGKLMQKIDTLTTPLLRQIAAFSRILTIGILLLAAATFAMGYTVYAFAADQMFLAAVGVAVAAIPEGLPAIMTITMAIGVERMARRNAIIRRLPAVETLGAVSVICSDKTGTFTRNEMCVRTIATGNDLLAVTGTGYAPHGDIESEGASVLTHENTDLEQLLLAALLCNDAGLRTGSDGRWEISGDPMEAALITVAMKGGLRPDDGQKAWPRRDEIPFDAAHRFMATLNQSHDGQSVIFVKGAPEKLLEICTTEIRNGAAIPLDRSRWKTQMDNMSSRGERVLALAMRQVDAKQPGLTFADVESDLMLLGLLGLADPPRDEAISAVAECHAAGIRVKMITGDHIGTALAIARQLGLKNTQKALSGTDLDALDDNAFATEAFDTDVFARTTPEQKLRLVTALQADGLVVAMTGDGVNDAPALKRADVGIAMGGKGSEAAKEAAKVVLADDNFASIAHAVEEGRTVYDNLKKAILYILPTNGGEAMTIAIAVALGLTLPITPVQILWVNMVTTVTLSLALAFEGAETNVMARPPRPVDSPLLSGFLLWRTCFVSIILVAGVFGIYFWLIRQGASLELARTAAVNTLVLFEIFHLFNIRRQNSPAHADILSAQARPAWISVAIVLMLQIAYTYLPPMQVLFSTEAMPPMLWGACAAVAACIFLIIEVEKWIFRLRRSNNV